ncbi:SAV_915 family protein [Streptomyces sp. NPDC087270]|uniref:SAV_915 family protein n=1 Tax=Streptomyces sp. NPDC087270 TaxID=3365774 RepID=UPI0037FFB240
MAATLHPEDPEPCEPFPAGPLFVPVRPGPAGCTARFFRTPLGTRTAVGFTSPERLSAALGAGQSWIRLSAPALRALAEPLGVAALTVDPRFSAPAPAAHAPAATPTPTPAPAPAPTPVPAPSARDWDPRHLGALRAIG